MTGAEGQPAPTSERSRLPLTFRQDDVTVQVPTRFPPQAVTFGQEVPPPPVPEIPPELTAPPVPGVPPVPDRAFPPELQPHEISAGPAAASARRTKWFLAIYRSVGLLRFFNGKIPETEPVTTFYGVPTKVVTLCAERVTVTRDCETLTAEPWPRFLLADVS